MDSMYNHMASVFEDLDFMSYRNASTKDLPSSWNENKIARFLVWKTKQIKEEMKLKKEVEVDSRKNFKRVMADLNKRKKNC